MTEAKQKPSRKLTLYRMAMLACIGLVVGTISAFATIAFVELVSWLNDLLLLVSTESRDQLSFGMLIPVSVTVLTIGGLVVGILLHFGVRDGKPLGPADTIYAVQLREKLPGPISGFFSTLAAILSLGCGASVGQYGPVVYLGSMIGQLASRLSLRIPDLRTISIACGVCRRNFNRFQRTYRWFDIHP